MISSIIKKLHPIKLGLIQKFVLTYCVLILLPLLVLFSYTYSKMSKITSDNILELSRQSYIQSKDFLDYKISRIFDISNSLVIDNDLTTILMKNPKNYPLNDQITDLYKLRDLSAIYEYDSDVSNVRLYVNDNFIYSNDNTNIFEMTSLSGSYALKKINDTGVRFTWFYQPSSKNYLSLLKTIKNPDNYLEDIGYLVLNFQQETINDIVNKINTIDGCISYIVDPSGRIIASSLSTDITQNYINMDTIKHYADNKLPMSKTVLNNGKYYIQSSLLNKTDWYLVNILPEGTMLSEINTQRTYLIFLAIFCGGTSIILAFIFVKWINKRLSKVVYGMREVNKGNFSHYIENTNTDELGELTNSYNYMIETITKLNKEQYLNGKAVKNAELKALQSQINPHFLYNTLDMINWMSYKNQNEEIRATVKNLVKFYKLTLNKGKDISNIHDELLHISLYVEIQNMRYSDRIKLIIDVHEDLQSHSLPKITLQPIIENAITHGILAKGGENGTITISANYVDEDIILSISDDGVGITDDYIDLIITDTPLNTAGSGYGLQNINTRLKLMYGNDYGLSFNKQFENGTKVEIRIPKSNI